MKIVLELKKGSDKDDAKELAERIENDYEEYADYIITKVKVVCG